MQPSQRHGFDGSTTASGRYLLTHPVSNSGATILSNLQARTTANTLSPTSHMAYRNVNKAHRRTLRHRTPNVGQLTWQSLETYRRCIPIMPHD
ncbi:hypothetical protein LY78DRAFT_663298 [Colletotrichum sublineola]|nr:hypothetical protein LY78DRAFT_663298 [Colletotrichum sublineola]